MKVYVEERLKHKKRVVPKVKRKKRLFRRPLRFPIIPTSLDVDLIKPEYLTGGFCGCGHRQPDGVCVHCITVECYDVD